MNNLDCNVFHETDGACCKGDEPCVSTPTPRPNTIIRAQTGMMRELFKLFVLLVLAQGFLFLAFYTFEQQQKARDLADQELRPSHVIGASK